MNREQEPKYDVDNEGRLFNRETTEVIPDHEPIFIIRAKDKNAIATLAYYQTLSTKADGRQLPIVSDRIKDFTEFAVQFPQDMKEAD